MKVAILSRFQNKVNRGAESVVKELAKRLSKKMRVDVLMGRNSDNGNTVIMETQ